VQLRDYQVDAVGKIRAAYAAGAKSIIYQLPTGGGKSAIFCHVAEQAAKRGTRTIILVHRRELLMQASKTLRFFGVPHGLIAPKYPYTNAMVRIASIQTLGRRLDHTPRADLIIVDEGHHCTKDNTWGRILARWGGARRLAVSATPVRLDGRGLGEVFDTMIAGPSMKSLVDAGHLAATEVYAPPMKADLSGVKTVAGDFDKHELAVRMDRSQVCGDAVAHYERLGQGRPGIAFCASLAASEHLADAFRAAGVPAEAIDGKMDDKKRDGILGRLASGETRIVTSVDLISEGFDCPDAAVAVLLRPTKSLGIFLQQVGRVMRPADGKGLALVLDHVGSVHTHGLPDADRVWTLEGRKKKKGERLPPVARCPVCFACFPPGPEACPMCHAELPVRERKGPEAVEGTLERVTGDRWEERRALVRQHAREQAECRTVEELVALGVRRGYGNPKGWAWRVAAGRRQRA
jgi:DNA repair protein RadD